MSVMEEKEPRRRSRRSFSPEFKRSVTGEWAPWIEFFAQAVAASADDAHRRVMGLLALQEELSEQARRALPRARLAIEIADDLIAFPILTVAAAQFRYGKSNQANRNAINAQAGLLNFERTIVDEFGEEYQLGDKLSVPLQLSGFRDPDVLASRQRAQRALPLDVQALLGRAAEATPELLADETFMMRVAFVPAVVSSGRNPDAVAYFVRPGEVPTELAETLERYVVLPKAARGPRPSIGGKDVVAEVQRRIAFRFNTNDHAAVARNLGVRPERGEPDRSLDEMFCDYVTAAKIYVYNQQWIDRVVDAVSTERGFREATGRGPVPKAVADEESGQP